MPAWFPRSPFGLVLAVLYVALGVYAVIDARSNQGGGWISLKGIGVALVTFPVSLPLEALGFKPNYQRNLDMALVIGACTALVYLLGVALGRIAQVLFGGTNAG
jgi:hypothetical protein